MAVYFFCNLRNLLKTFAEPPYQKRRLTMKTISTSIIVGAISLFGAVSTAGGQAATTRPAALKTTVSSPISTRDANTLLDAQWGLTALSRESDYITNCSFTRYAAHGVAVTMESDAYGAIND